MKHAVLFVLFAFGCAEQAPVTSPVVETVEGFRIVEGSPEAVGVLAFLNDASTTFEVLDDEVRLDRRAAESLIEHRDGPDGLHGTADDLLYQSIAEVDRRYFVGTAALMALADWAWEHGWVPSDADEVIGTWDGVTFTTAEAEAVLELANTAEAAFLDDEVGLDRRAVDSILDARPIATVADLADLYYVGGTALRRLKDVAALGDCAAPGWSTEIVFADEAGLPVGLPEALAAAVDELLAVDGWCGEAYGQPWFEQVAIDRFDCKVRGATVTLGQLVDAQHGLTYGITFDLDEAFEGVEPTCAVR